MGMASVVQIALPALPFLVHDDVPEPMKKEVLFSGSTIFLVLLSGRQRWTFV